jgi:hypothetical protein
MNCNESFIACILATTTSAPETTEQSVLKDETSEKAHETS